MYPLIFTVLALAGAGFLARLVRGPSLPDRVLALDGLVTVTVAATAVVAARQGDDVWLSVLVVVAIVGFVGTSAIARLIESRGA